MPNKWKEGWEDGEYPEVSDGLKKMMTLDEFEKRIEEMDAGKKVIEDGGYYIEIQHGKAVEEEHQNGRLIKRLTYDSITKDIDVVETYSYRTPKIKAKMKVDVYYDVHKD